MRHLTDETLARLVDEQATAAEEEHLRSCEICSTVLRELREQTEALASLPALRPPAGDWEELQARLIRKGLIGDGPVEGTDSVLERVGPGLEEGGPRTEEAGRGARPTRGHTDGGPYGGPAHRRFLIPAPWLQAAAAVVLFLGGTAFGTWMTPAGGNSVDGGITGISTDSPVEETGRLAGDPSGTGDRVDEAALQLRTAEDRYVEALVTYRELLREADGRDPDVAEDPAARYAALEALVAASQEAIRHAPADPFFNGVLASTMAERQEAIRQISTSDDDNWF